MSYGLASFKFCECVPFASVMLAFFWVSQRNLFEEQAGYAADRVKIRCLLGASRNLPFRHDLIAIWCGSFAGAWCRHG